MEALKAMYGSDSDESDGSPSPRQTVIDGEHYSHSALDQKISDPLPPPPLDLLQPPNFIDYSSLSQGSRVRNFPHIEGNYSLHIYIPVFIPSTTRKHMACTMKRLASLINDLYSVDVDYSLSELCKDEQNLEKILLSREFHISLGRTVGIQVHQIDSILGMLRAKLHSQRQYWMEFDKWEVFLNDDVTRSFLSLEITGQGLQEITKQINSVNEVYRLHGLPEFYKDPRPHISLLWGLGDISYDMKHAIERIDKSQNIADLSQRHFFRCKFNGIVCKIGRKSYDICKFPD